jgi:DNA-binding response OmpR family regulator
VPEKNLIVAAFSGIEHIRGYPSIVNTPASTPTLHSTRNAETTDRPSILVVEDDAAVEASLCTTLRTLGFIAFHADSIDEAMKVLERETIDAVTLDVAPSDPSGPKQPGLSLLSHLRATRNHAHVPVLILTDTLLSDDDLAFVRKHRAEVHYQPQPYYELASHLNWLLDRK